jgi:hypothetical protein
MARKRHRLNWHYDDEIQQFTTPSGRTITLREIAALLQNQLECWHDFHGPWTGWRMRGNRLIPPGQSYGKNHMAPHNTGAFIRWLTCYEQQKAPNEYHSGRHRNRLKEKRQDAYPGQRHANTKGRYGTPLDQRHPDEDYAGESQQERQQAQIIEIYPYLQKQATGKHR